MSLEKPKSDNRELIEELKSELSPQNFQESSVDQSVKLDSAKRPDKKIPEKETQITDRINLALEGKDFTRMDGDALLKLELTEKGDGLLAALFLEKKDGTRSSFFTDISDIQQEYAPGTEFHVNFHENEHAEQTIGAGDMLPPQIRTVIIVDDQGRPRIGTRQNGDKVGYYDRNGYIPVFSKYTIIIPSEMAIRAMADREPTEKNLFDNMKNIFFTKEEVDKNREGETASKLTFIQDVEKIKEIGRIDFMEYIAQEKKFEGAFASLKKEDMNLIQGADEQDFKQIAAAQGIEGAQYQVLKRIFYSISEQESGHKYAGKPGTPVYSAKYKGERAIGRYQIMPSNWIQWSGELLSRMPDLESSKGLLVPSAKNQDLMAFTQMVNNFQRYSHLNEADHIQMVAATWFGNPTGADTPEELSTRNYYGKSPREYASDVLNRYRGVA